jgi:hypothetical protein
LAKRAPSITGASPRRTVSTSGNSGINDLLTIPPATAVL